MHAALLLLAVALPDPPSKPIDPRVWDDFSVAWGKRIEAERNPLAKEKLWAEYRAEWKKRFPAGTPVRIAGTVSTVEESTRRIDGVDTKIVRISVELTPTKEWPGPNVYKCDLPPKEREWAAGLKQGDPISLRSKLLDQVAGALEICTRE